jgi:dihydropteroate synthase
MSANVRGTEGRFARGALTVRGRRLEWGVRTYLMGIVNATPDSFSGDGCPSPLDALALALELDALGADIIDVGGESTRPGHAPIDAAEECRRLIPVVRGIRERLSHAIVSIDTFKPEVFLAARAAGGDMLNSIWGLDDALLGAALECDAPVVVMHNKRVPIYEHAVVAEVLDYLERQAARAVRAGIAAERILLDPGIGFGKLPEHNLAVLGALERVVALGFPTLLGTSRKSTIGKLTGKPVESRTYGTAATVALAVAAGIDVVRVHDVAEMRDVVQVADAIARRWRPTDWSESL